MKRPPLSYLLLLPLLTVLLFGNCGGGVRGLLGGMNYSARTALRASVVRRQSERTLARRQLHGRARHDAYRRIEKAADATADSLLDTYLIKKFNNRRRKLERQLLREYRPLGQ